VGEERRVADTAEGAAVDGQQGSEIRGVAVLEQQPASGSRAVNKHDGARRRGLRLARKPCSQIDRVLFEL